MKFSEYIDQERERRGINTNALARKSGLSSTTVYRLIKEKRKPAYHVARQLCAALDLPMPDMAEDGEIVEHPKRSSVPPPDSRYFIADTIEAVLAAKPPETDEEREAIARVLREYLEKGQ